MSDVWQQTIDSAQQLRRELHASPELTWQERRTAERIRRLLTGLEISWESCAETGTLARLGTEKKGPHIALRGDIDALPIREQTGLPWKSTVDGTMHACGHDGHTATLCATARWLKHHEDKLPGPVTLVFQPAEEGGHGAQKMIEDGALKGIDEIYGWHNWPAIPFGKLACPDSLVMSGNGTFDITLTGVGGHASQPELCRDPVLAASAVTLALQQIVSGRLPPQKSAVVSVTSIDAPSGPTTIPDRAVVGGSIRIPDMETRDQVSRLIDEISTEVAASYGVECDVQFFPRYNATINHRNQAAHVRALWREEFGDDSLDSSVPMPLMASEDFSYYLEEIPGAFLLVGADDGPEHRASCHSPHYDFNDQLIPVVTRLYARLAGLATPVQ